MADLVYTTRDGDVLDEICLARYGTTAVVERVLEANFGLADEGAVLDAGVRVVLPDLTVAEVTPTVVRLWD